MSDVVVVGAGIAGLSLLRELLAAGADATILDRAAAPPTESTARSAWMLRTDVSEPALEPVARRSAAIWRSGALGEVRLTGGFLLGSGGDRDVSELVPAARGRGEWRPQDGLVDASSALRALAASPSRARFGVEASALGLRGLPGISWRDGGLPARVVVNAAGAWAGALGGLPLQPLTRHVALAECRSVARDAPFVWDLEASFYFRPHEAGLLICACDEVPSSPGDASVDERAVEAAAATGRRLQPGLGPLRVLGAWSGQRTFAPDRLPVVGWDAERPWVFHFAGLGGHGITLAPGLAQLAAQALARGPGGEMPEELRPFSPARLRTRP